MVDINPKLYRLERELTRAQVIVELAETPVRLRAIVAGASPDALVRREGGGEWTAMESLRHVRDIVQVYGLRFKWMILQDDSFLADYDENQWVEASPDTTADLGRMLDETAAYRGETIRLLWSIDDAGWERSGRHEVLGRVQLDAYVRHQLEHERQHLAQLERSLDDSGAGR